MDNRKISLCITTYNRYQETLESFVQVANDDRISEIVIVDDCSDLEIYQKLKIAVEFCDKVKLFRNINNQDCYRNKKHAISFALNEWCIIFDSDNILTKEYIDRLYQIPVWDYETIYQPAWAQPAFYFRPYEGLTFTKENIAENLHRPMLSTMLNAMNYFVNRDKYSSVWQKDINPHTADSILQNYNHLASGGKIYVVPGMFYEHRIHNGSHYKNNNHLTGNLYQEIENNLKQLR